MVGQDAFTLADFAELSRDPVVAPMLAALVWVTEDGITRLLGNAFGASARCGRRRRVAARSDRTDADRAPRALRGRRHLGRLAGAAVQVGQAAAVQTGLPRNLRADGAGAQGRAGEPALRRSPAPAQAGARPVHQSGLGGFPRHRRRGARLPRLRPRRQNHDRHRLPHARRGGPPGHRRRLLHPARRLPRATAGRGAAGGVLRGHARPRPRGQRRARGRGGSRSDGVDHRDAGGACPRDRGAAQAGQHRLRRAARDHRWAARRVLGSPGQRHRAPPTRRGGLYHPGRVAAPRPALPAVRRRRPEDRRGRRQGAVARPRPRDQGPRDLGTVLTRGGDPRTPDVRAAR